MISAKLTITGDGGGHRETVFDIDSPEAREEAIRTLLRIAGGKLEVEFRAICKWKDGETISTAWGNLEETADEAVRLRDSYKGQPGAYMEARFGLPEVVIEKRFLTLMGEMSREGLEREARKPKNPGDLGEIPANAGKVKFK